MLDQKLIREKPKFIEENLSLRGKFFNISPIHKLTLEKKDIDIEISNLQSESKKLSKSIGKLINKSQNNSSQEINELKSKGNKYRIKISEFEDKKRILDDQIRKEILSLPNFPSKNAPIGKDENENVEIKTWGDTWPTVEDHMTNSVNTL